MLLQSYAGFIDVFPAIPANWKNVSFNTLRAEGGFLVSARKVNGIVSEIKISATRSGKAVVKLPSQHFKMSEKNGVNNLKRNGDYIELKLTENGSATLILSD